MKNSIRIFRFAFILLSVFSGNDLLSQNNFSVSHYTSKNGLPQNSVKSLAMDNNDFLWMTTESGVVRFDGRNFKVFNTTNTAVLTGDRVLGIYKTSKDEMLMYDPYGGLYQIKANHIEVIKKGNIGSNNFLMMKGTIPGKEFYLHYVTPEVGKARDTNWFAPVASIFPEQGSNYFVRTKKGIALYHDFVMQQQFNLEQYFPQKFFMIDDHIYFSSKENRIFLFDKKNMTVSQCEIKGDLILDKLFSFSLINDDFWDGASTFIRLGYNLYRLTQNDNPLEISSRLVTSDLPRNCNISSLIYDPKNHFFAVGTDTKGLYIFREKNFRTVIYGTPEEGTNNAYYSQMAIDSTHVFTDWSREFGPYSAVAGKFPIKKNQLESIHKDRQGNIFFTHADSLIKLNGNDFSRKLISKLKNGGGLCFFEEGDSIWTGTSYGIAYIKNDSLHFAYKFESPNSYSNPFSILRDGDNMLWFSNCNGVFKLDLKTHEVDTLKSLYQKCARNLTMFRGFLMIGTYDRGYYLSKNGRVVQMPVDQNNYLSKVHTFINDSNGYTWMTTNQGLFKTRFNDLEKYFYDTTSQVSYIYYGEEDGIDNTEFNGGCNPSGLVLKSGYVSLSTMDGLVWFKPLEVFDIKSDSPVIIDAVYFDDTLTQINNLLHVPSSTQIIRIEFATAYWGNINNFELEYKSSDMNQWIRLTGSRRSIEFPNVRSGNYSFNIRKRFGFGDDDFVKKKIEIFVGQKYYQTSWFVLLCLIGSVIFLVAVARIYAWNITKNNKALEEKIFQRTLELRNTNDALQQSVNVKDKLIAIISHDIITPLRFISMVAGKSADATGYLEEKTMHEVLSDIKQTSEKLHNNAQNILNWIKYQNKRITLNITHVAVGALTEDVAEMLKEMAAARSSEIINLVSPEDIIKTDKNILSIVLHNILSNSIKFTEYGTVSVRSRTEGTDYIISIEDTGTGMREKQFQRIRDIINKKSVNASEPTGHGSGLGYIIISELIEFLHGTIDVESVYGKGTVASVRLISCF